MHHTEPTVFMIGKTQAIRENIRAWLDFIGAEEFEVPSPNVGSDCSLLVTLAGKRCFDEDTEILTSDGWKLFKDLDKTEEVMTLNPHTGRCEWQSPKDYIEYQHDGSMLFAESRDVSFAVTPDHRQFGWMGHAGRSSERVKNLPDFVDTSDIECREFRILSAPVNIRNIANWEAWIGRVVSKINLRSPVTVQNKSNQFGSYGIRDYSSDDYEFNTESQVIAFAKLCIYYATEGCQLHKSESYGGVAIYGSSHIDEIINICSILGLKYNITEDKRNNVKRIVIGGGSAISYYLSENCGSGSNNKCLPRWVLDLPVECLKELWNIFVETDGHRYDNGAEVLITTSEKLAGNVQEILCKLGFSSSCLEDSEGVNFKVWRVRKKQGQPIVLNRRSSSSVFSDLYNGKVYCVSTDNGIVLVRRYGKVHFSGNCYMSFQPGLNPNVTRVRTDMTEFIDNILKVVHGSVLEHCVYTFAIENISRVFTGELNRHRAGMAISEGSMRYIRYEDIPYWVPFSIRENEDDTPEIASKKGETREVMDRAFQEMENNYSELVNLWKKELSPGSSFKIKKHLTSMFRRMVGMGVSTGGVWSGNLRALRHVFTMRCSEAAEEEILHVASMLLEMIIESEPNFFKDFEKVGGYWKPKYMKV